MNWNSKTGEFTQVVKESTKALEYDCNALRAEGKKVKEIASIKGISVSRVYELTR